MSVCDSRKGPLELGPSIPLEFMDNCRGVCLYFNICFEEIRVQRTRKIRTMIHEPMWTYECKILESGRKLTWKGSLGFIKVSMHRALYSALHSTDLPWLLVTNLSESIVVNKFTWLILMYTCHRWFALTSGDIVCTLYTEGLPTGPIYTRKLGFNNPETCTQVVPCFNTRV